MPGPTPISALIHAATMVAAGVYLVARLLPLFQRSGSAQNVLAVIATVTMIGSACFALAADDLKRVLAWSTVSQLALMFGALAIGGMGAGVLHLLTHGAFKALLFLAAGSVISAVGGQGLAELGGLRRALPLTFATMTIGLLALAGVPPFAGFFSKDAILGRAAHEAAMGSARAWLVLVGVCITSLLTAAYATRLWLVVFFGRPVQPAEGMPPISEPSRLMTVPLVALAVAAAGGGAFVVAPGFLGVTAEPFHLVALGLGLGVVAIGIALSYAGWRRTEGDDPAVLLGPLRPAFARELSYDVLLDATVGRLVRLGSCAAAAAETDVVEPYVRGGVGAAGLLGRGIRRIHAGNITRYLTSVAVGAVGVALVIGVVQR